MSAAGISNIAISQPPTFSSLQHQRNADWHQLADSLQSGDLAGAQQAFSDITALRQNTGRGGHFHNQQIAQDFGALGQALDAGDLAGAQQAFAKFQQDVQASRTNAVHGPRPGPQPDNSGSDIVVNLSSGGGSGTSNVSAPATLPGTVGNAAGAGGPLPPITSTVVKAPVPPITSSTAGSGSSNSVGSSTGASSSGAITLNLAKQAGGNSEQITINFGQGSSNAAGQIILNVSNGHNGAERVTLNFGDNQSQPENVQINLLA